MTQCYADGNQNPRNIMVLKTIQLLCVRMSVLSGRRMDGSASVCCIRQFDVSN